MKNILSAAALLFTLLAFGQAEEPIKVIAKRIASPQCDKMCIAKYTILKNVQGSASNTVIEIGCQPDKRLDNSPETALLTIIPTKLKDYYIFPDYDESKGIENAKFDSVDRAYLEACETGSGPCKALSFSRNSDQKQWFLMVPCGGTYTSVKLTDANGKRIREINAKYGECPPMLDLSTVPDGKYYVTIVSAALNGKIEINLTTR